MTPDFPDYKMKNDQEYEILDMVRTFLGAHQTYSPKEYRKGSATREPCELYWDYEGFSLLVYAKDRRSKSWQAQDSRNLAQAVGWLKAWKEGVLLEDEFDRHAPIPYNNEKLKIAISITRKSDDHNSIYRRLDFEQKLSRTHKVSNVMVVSLADWMLQRLIQHNVSIADLIAMLAMVPGNLPTPASSLETDLYLNSRMRAKNMPKRIQLFGFNAIGVKPSENSFSKASDLMSSMRCGGTQQGRPLPLDAFEAWLIIELLAMMFETFERYQLSNGHLSSACSILQFEERNICIAYFPSNDAHAFAMKHSIWRFDCDRPSLALIFTNVQDGAVSSIECDMQFVGPWWPTLEKNRQALMYALANPHMVQA